ncbi:MAG TPA: ABC transporter permease [Myxococcota bacterium]|nr:ABC transporter permease [Myxococcota bacterium]
MSAGHAAWRRVLGGTLLALLVLVFARPLGAGLHAAVALAGASGLAGGALLPPRALRRLAFLVPSLALLVLLTCLLMYVAPGSPFASERVAAPQVEQALRAQYGVPRSGVAFFAVYMERLVVEGSLGPSLKVQGRSVAQLLLPALPVSLALGGLALVLALGVGVLVGVRAGLRPGSLADRASLALTLVGIALPSFVVGALLAIVFALRLGWLPVAGWGGARHLVLPAITLSLPPAATIARLARGGTIETLAQDFVRTARAKGLPERVVVWRHALRGALLPVVSYLGPAAAAILTGSFVVETLFGVPGMGQWFVKGAVNRDYSVVLGTTLLYASLVTLLNLAVDAAYAWLDPRVAEDA